MRPLLNASLLPKVLISLCTCVEVVPIEVQEHVGRSSRVSEGLKTGGNNGQMIPKCCEGIQRTQSCFRGVNLVSEAFLGVWMLDGWWGSCLVSPIV
jgi:hypothetical protein